MMTNEFIKNHQFTFEYELKAGTKTSYYLTSGQVGYLPVRIGITKEKFAPVHHTGQSKYEKIKGQMKATFRKSETSPYRQIKNTLHTSIYEPEKYPSIFGYGDIQGTKDLIIFRTSNNGKTFIIDIFRGLLFTKEEIFNYLIKQQRCN